MTRLLFLISFLISCGMRPGIPHVIIDADTDNELDDVLAISAAFQSGAMKITGVTASQWEGGNMKPGGNKNPCKTEKTAYTSWLVNKIILQLLRKENTPCLKGAEFPVIYGRGEKDNVPQKNPASDFIIKKAGELPDNEKITLICLGSLTNIASAILSNPDIAKKIALYWVGTSYDFKSNTWGRVEFNAANDQDALDVVLDATDLELHIMPNNVSGKLRFNIKESLSRLEGKKGISPFIKERWEAIVEGHQWTSWTMWDLALIYAVTDPQWAEEKVVHTPPGNNQREIYIYSNIRSKLMAAKFWADLK